MITGLVKPDKGVIELDGHAVTSAADVPARAAWHRLPSAGSLDFSRPKCRGQHPRGAGSQRARPKRARGDARTRCWRNSISRAFARRRRSPCPAANGGAAKSRGRSRANLPSCCSTNRSRASIPIAVGDIQDLVRHLKSRGIGVLITDHNVRETLGLIDRAYIIHSGHVLTEGPPTRSSNTPTSGAIIWAKTLGCRAAVGPALWRNHKFGKKCFLKIGESPELGGPRLARAMTL